MPLGAKVGVGPDDSVLDGEPAPPKKGGHSPPIFGPCLLWTNGWIDQGATWYGGRSRLRPRCVRRGPSSPLRKGAQPPNFRPMSIAVKQSPMSVTAEHL